MAAWRSCDPAGYGPDGSCGWFALCCLQVRADIDRGAGPQVDRRRIREPCHDRALRSYGFTSSRFRSMVDVGGTS